MRESSSSFRMLLATILVVVMICLSSIVKADEEPIDFNELLNSAKQLESASFILHKASQEQLRNRMNRVYKFIKTTKSPHCDRKFEETLQVASEFKLKAYELIKENKDGNKGWLSNVLGNSFGPISRLRTLSKSDAYLNDVTKRYETLTKSGLLKEQNVDCDVNKYKIKALFEIMLILQAEVKYLITEPVYVINRAIYDRLKADRFVSASNFYETRKPNNAQRKLLLEFFASRLGYTKLTVGDAEDHYYDPGEFTTGRLLETCQILLEFSERLANNHQENNKLCTDNSIDPLSTLFAEQFQPDRFAATSNFCDHLLEAL